MISCEQHDYVEIACMYHYLIKLTLNSGSEFEGVAVDVKRNDIKEECIKVRVDSEECLIVLDSVSKMEVLEPIENPHFKVVVFK